MARINFRVIESNDLSRDGSNNRRVTLEAKALNADGTGLDKDYLGPFKKGSAVSGRVELLIDTEIQVKFFTLNALIPVDFPTLVIGGPGAADPGALSAADQARGKKAGKAADKAAAKADKAARADAKAKAKGGARKKR